MTQHLDTAAHPPLPASIPRVRLPTIPQDPRSVGLHPGLIGLQMPLPPFVILDTETSGLPQNKWAKVVELGAVAVGADGVILSTFDSLVQWPKPGDIAPAGSRHAFKGNDIELTDLHHAPTPWDAWANFCAWSAVLPQGVEVAAYNKSFDQRMTKKTFSHVDGYHVPWSEHCLYQMARDAHPKGSKVFKLEALCRRLGILRDGEPQLHRALPDALLTYQVWWVLWNLAERPSR
jgi:DNA polymerase III epsilon subunit-like protein